MRTVFATCITGFLLLLTSSCAGPAPEYRPTATIKDLMDSVVDPNADFLWDSVATEVSAKGIIEKAPSTPDEWREARRHAIALVEISNSLQIPGRPVAQPGERADDPEVEQGPEVIKTLIDSDRASWIKFAHGLHDASALMLKYIDNKDVKGVLDAGEKLDEACESCHKTYWYPDKKGGTNGSTGSVRK